MREREDIWDELDDEERYYGSLTKSSDHLPLGHSRRDSRHSFQLERQSSHDTDPLLSQAAALSRAKTTPVSKKHNFRPRSEDLHGLKPDVKNAERGRDSLTKNLRDWWRARWKGAEEEEEEEEHQEGPGASR